MFLDALLLSLILNQESPAKHLDRQHVHILCWADLWMIYIYQDLEDKDCMCSNTYSLPNKTVLMNVPRTQMRGHKQTM